MTTLNIDIGDAEMLARLANRAKGHNRSVSEEIVEIVRSAFRREELITRADRVAAMTPRDVPQTDTVLLLREDRSR